MFSYIAELDVQQNIRKGAPILSICIMFSYIAELNVQQNIRKGAPYSEYLHNV